MKCKYCNVNIGEKEKFCPKCGKSIIETKKINQVKNIVVNNVKTNYILYISYIISIVITSILIFSALLVWSVELFFRLLFCGSYECSNSSVVPIEFVITIILFIIITIILRKKLKKNSVNANPIG